MNKQSKDYYCRKCSSKFTTRHSRYRHKKACSLNRVDHKIYTCSQCEEVFSRKHNLDIPLNAVRTKKRKAV